MAAANGLTATAGDFNADGKLDLAVGVPSSMLSDSNGIVLDQQNIGEVGIFWSIAQRAAIAGPALLFHEPDVMLAGTAELDQFGAFPPRPRLDLNRDGIHDLVIGTPSANAIGSGIVRLVGTVAQPGVEAQPFGYWVVPVALAIGAGIMVGTHRAPRRVLGWIRERKAPAHIRVRVEVRQD